MNPVSRRRWRNRIVLTVALSILVLAASRLVTPANAALSATTKRLVVATVRVDPILVGEHFLLQAVSCQRQFGFRCVPMTLPDGRGSVARRPSIVPDNAVSRRDARAEIAEGLGSPAAWWRAFISTPGAALYTARFVSSQGWEAWGMLALSLAVSLTLLFWFVDSALACVVLSPIVAIGVSRLLGIVLQGLSRTGWEAPLLFLLALIIVTAGIARDLFEGSSTFERYLTWRRKRDLARAPLEY